MLHFRNLSLLNWRNFRKVDLPIGDRNFIIGPNASGKSNLLDVFKFLGELARPGGGLQQAVQDRGGLKMIRCLAARQYTDVEITVSLVDPARPEDPAWRYEIGIRQEKGGHNRTMLRFERVYKGGVAILQRPDPSDDADPERLTQTAIEQINSNKDFRDVADAFAATTYLHLVPQLVRHPEISNGRVLARDPFGQSFLRRLADTPKNYRDARLNLIGNLLRIAVPKLSDLKYVIDDREGGMPHLEAIYEHWRPHGVIHREREFSDGTLRLIGLLWSVLEDDSLLLLEEPELSLHTEIVARLAPLLDKVNRRRRRQILVSTHSPELLSDKGIGSSEILILLPQKEGTQVKLASSLMDVHRMMTHGMSAADAALPQTRPQNIEQLVLFSP